MRPWPAICLLPILVGCVTDEAGQQAVKDAYAACTMDAVRRFDDGRSDPASVAMGVAGACAGQYAQLTNTMSGTMITERGQNYMRDQMRTEELRLATAAVLTYRASKTAR